jgi:hypothetical protein
MPYLLYILKIFNHIKFTAFTWTSSTYSSCDPKAGEIRVNIKFLRMDISVWQKAGPREQLDDTHGFPGILM